MNKENLVNRLKALKEKGVFEIKAEFEAEGTRINELALLKDITSSAGLPILMKTGGVEAITDMYLAYENGASMIVAPMAESAYAVQKFLDCIKIFQDKGIEGLGYAINVETIGCYDVIDEILALKDINLLSGMTVGRVDFAGSLGHDRAFVNSPEMMGYVETVFQKCRDKGIGTAVGGGIDVNCLDFVKALIDKGLLDKYETRKIVFSPSCVDLGPEFMKEAVTFEYEWLQFKRAFHLQAADEDLKRLEMIKKRLDE